MIKKVLLAIALICPMLLSAQTLKIGLVDFATVLQAMPDYTAAMTQLKEVSGKYEAELKKLGEEMNRQMTEFQNMPENELPAIKERKAREISDYQQKMQQFEQSASEDLNKMHGDLMGPITQKISQAVESVGREGSYSLIQMYDPQLVLYHAEPVEDVTPLVKAKLGIK
ncbi:MAG: OmpH family outer membrane protein [Muribaculaceae bacterium]|nr:OmpH family outer membrane protein [Muribaculaceae bacterium]MDE6523805.1 OmpH family outer membrane protein [Muribaculaceae bacterium]